MTFWQWTQNAIVDLLTQQEYAKQNDERFSAPGVGDELPGGGRFRDSHLVGIDPSPQPVARQINPYLPVPCYAEWESGTRQGQDPDVWVRVGKLFVPYSARSARAGLVEGVAVRLRDAQPGKEGFWYELRSIVTDRPLFAGNGGTMTFDLREIQVELQGMVQ